MTTDLKQSELIKLINERFPNLSCPRCGLKKFMLLDDPEQGMRTGVRLTGPEKFLPKRSIEINTATVVCTSCGRIEQFALSYLQTKND